MTSLLKYPFLLLAVFSLLPAIYGQSANFDLDAYKSFLSSHKDLTTNQLLSAYPAGAFKGNISLRYSDVPYSDSIEVKYIPTSDEKALIEKNGFMVSERLSFPRFSDAFFDIHGKDLPLYISTDAILDVIHKSYNNILADLELQILIPKLAEFLNRIHEQVPSLATVYYSNSKMDVPLKDLDVYLTVARKLLTNKAEPYYAENNQIITGIIEGINSGTLKEDSLFSSTPRQIDFSQFTLRGHYAIDRVPQLSNYFRAMMWLGRIELYLLPPRALFPPRPEDIKRQTILSCLLMEAVQKADQLKAYEDIDAILCFLSGEQDNVTIPDLLSLTGKLNIKTASQLLDEKTLKASQDTLKTQPYAFQKILSQVLTTGFNEPDSIIPASSLLLFGQRFLVDTYISSQVVFDKITYQDKRILRMLPSSLDILFALGNDAAAQLLVKELDTYKYSRNLAALRYLTGSYDDNFWNSSLYNLWLNSIRKLNSPIDRKVYPLFMQTAAFWQEKINTQLASWAELRHDNILYGKQSYTAMPTCVFPFCYVEPTPEFYKQIKLFSDKAKSFFDGLTFSDAHTQSHISIYFQALSLAADNLFNISQKELSNIPLSESETKYLKSIIGCNRACGTYEDSWYEKLLYLSTNYSVYNKNAPDYIVADVHTAPGDSLGHTVGWVLHAGTGPVNLGVFVVPGPGNSSIACVGPVMNYNEYLSTNFKRLSDSEWQEFYSKNITFKPGFVNLYLADSKGTKRSAGASLFTSIGIPHPGDPVIPESIYLGNNYPNPFNSSTVIRFSIPYALSLQPANLSIYNISGELIKELVNENLPSGSYLARWDGTNGKGKAVTSGVYLYNLVVGGKSSSGKMTLLK